MKLKMLAQSKGNHSRPETFDEMTKLWIQLQHKPEFKLPAYVLYHNFESDDHGDFMMTICVVNNDDNDFEINIDKKKYKKYVVDARSGGRIAEVWQRILRDEKTGIIKRTYQMDFEEYNEDGEINVYIEIEPELQKIIY